MSTWALSRNEGTLLSSIWTLIRSKLPSPNFNSSVKTERSFTICYLNVVIRPLCGNLDICLNYYFWSRNSVCMLLVADRDRKWRCSFGSRFSVGLLHNSAYFATEIHFSHENPSTRKHLLIIPVRGQGDCSIFNRETLLDLISELRSGALPTTTTNDFARSRTHDSLHSTTAPNQGLTMWNINKIKD